MVYAVAPLSLLAMLLVAPVAAAWTRPSSRAALSLAGAVFAASAAVYVASDDCYETCLPRWSAAESAQPVMACLLVLALVAAGLPLLRDRRATVVAAGMTPLVAWFAVLVLGQTGH